MAFFYLAEFPGKKILSRKIASQRHSIRQDSVWTVIYRDFSIRQVASRSVMEAVGKKMRIFHGGKIVAVLCHEGMKGR